MKRVSLLCLVLICLSHAKEKKEDLYEKAKERTKYQVEQEYLRSKESFIQLRRDVSVKRKKERFKDMVESKKRGVVEDLLKFKPSVYLPVQGVAGDYAIVDGVVIRSGTATPYGNLEVKGSQVYVGSGLVFPFLKADYQPIADYLKAIDIEYYKGEELSLSPLGASALPLPPANPPALPPPPSSQPSPPASTPAPVSPPSGAGGVLPPPKP